MARDVVEQNLGHRVDLTNAQDVRALNSFTEQLVAFNGKSIVDGKAHLAVGETINIPPQGVNPNSVSSESSVSNQTSVPTETPIDTSNISVNYAHVRFGSPEWERQTQSNREVNPGHAMYDPIEPAGFQGEPGETWTEPQSDSVNVLRRMYLESPRDLEDGSKMYLYKGDLADGNQFMASEKHDAEGQLRMRKAMYRHGAPMRFQTESGPLDVNVKFIQSCRDRETGAWRTEIELEDRSQPNGKAKDPVRLITTPDGKSRPVTKQEYHLLKRSLDPGPTINSRFSSKTKVDTKRAQQCTVSGSTTPTARAKNRSDVDFAGRWRPKVLSKTFLERNLSTATPSGFEWTIRSTSVERPFQQSPQTTSLTRRSSSRPGPCRRE